MLTISAKDGTLVPPSDGLLSAETRSSKQCFDAHSRRIQRAPIVIGFGIERSETRSLDWRVRREGLDRTYQAGDRKPAGRAPLVCNSLGWVKDIKIKMDIEPRRLPRNFLHRAQETFMNWDVCHANMLQKINLIGLNIASAYERNAFAWNR